MKKSFKLTLKILEYIGYALSLALVYLYLASLHDWWGIFWVAIALAIPILIVAAITVVYRLQTGSWSSGFLLLGGLFSGCIGLLILSVAMGSYPIIFRIVEGKWPLTYLIICAILGGTQAVIQMITELAGKSSKKSA